MPYYDMVLEALKRKKSAEEEEERSKGKVPIVDPSGFHQEGEEVTMEDASDNEEVSSLPHVSSSFFKNDEESSDDDAVELPVDDQNATQADVINSSFLKIYYKEF